MLKKLLPPPVKHNPLFYAPTTFLANRLTLQINTLVDKNSTKKIISVFGFLAHLKIAILQDLPLAVFFGQPYFIRILEILRREFFIFNYFKIPFKRINRQLTTRVDKLFLNNLICVIFKPTNLFGSSQSFRGLIFISTPSRTIFITYCQLKKLVHKNSSVLYLVNTSAGLMSHSFALKKNLGGNLLCQIF